MFSSSSVFSPRNLETVFKQRDFRLEYQESENRRPRKLLPEGKVQIRLKNLTHFDIDFNSNETIEDLYGRMEQYIKPKKYNFVCKLGFIQPGTQLYNYHITDGTRIVAVLKGSSTRERVMSRNGWIREMHERAKNPDYIKTMFHPKPSFCSFGESDITIHSPDEQKDVSDDIELVFPKSEE